MLARYIIFNYNMIIAQCNGRQQRRQEQAREWHGVLLWGVAGGTGKSDQQQDERRLGQRHTLP